MISAAKKAYLAAYREAHREQIRAQQKGYRMTNWVAVRYRKLAYRDAHPMARQRWDKTYREKHPNRNKARSYIPRAQQRAQFTKHKVSLTRILIWLISRAHKDEVRSTSQAYYYARREELTAKQRAYRRSNHEKVRARERRNDAKRRGAGPLLQGLAFLSTLTHDTK